MWEQTWQGTGVWNPCNPPCNPPCNYSCFSECVPMISQDICMSYCPLPPEPFCPQPRPCVDEVIGHGLISTSGECGKLIVSTVAEAQFLRPLRTFKLDRGTIQSDNLFVSAQGNMASNVDIYGSTNAAPGGLLEQWGNKYRAVRFLSVHGDAATGHLVGSCTQFNFEARAAPPVWETSARHGSTVRTVTVLLTPQNMKNFQSPVTIKDVFKNGSLLLYNGENCLRISLPITDLSHQRNFDVVVQCELNTISADLVTRLTALSTASGQLNAYVAASPYIVCNFLWQEEAQNTTQNWMHPVPRGVIMFTGTPAPVQTMWVAITPQVNNLRVDHVDAFVPEGVLLTASRTPGWATTESSSNGAPVVARLLMNANIGDKSVVAEVYSL
jgi:hypothetical protein